MKDTGKVIDSMEIKVVLSSSEIIRGLKHYRRIARQDLLHASLTPDSERYRQHAEARRAIYAHLASVAETQPPLEVAREALRCYQQLPFVTGTPEDAHLDVKGRENALENFFLLIGLEPKIRRQVRSQRAPLNSQPPSAPAAGGAAAATGTADALQDKQPADA